MEISWRLAVPAAMLCALAGCATGVKGSPRQLCYEQGLQPGTPAFSACWKGERDRQFAGDLGGVVIGILAATPPPLAPHVPAPDDRLLDQPTQRQCVYYTDKGKRTLLTTGACPLLYGE